MTKEEIVKELDELGNVLYNKFGTDSYLERCTIHDLKTKIKALIIADVVQAQPEKVCKGSMSLGTGCGKCKRCKRELEHM